MAVKEVVSTSTVAIIAVAQRDITLRPTGKTAWVRIAFCLDHTFDSKLLARDMMQAVVTTSVF